MHFVLLKKGREKSVIHRHPWVFSGAILTHSTPQGGDIVQVLDYQKQLLGYGFWSYDSQISIRIFEFTRQPISIDFTYWFDKWRKIWCFKKQWLEPNTNAFRFIHAESDQMPGLIVDIYGKVAVIQAMTLGARLLIPLLQEYLFEQSVAYHFLKADSQILQKEGIESQKGWITEPPNELWFQENGIYFFCDVEHGQKTGFFLDQKDNRQLVANIAQNKTVANVFAYSGGFSLYALKNYAAHVTSVDASQRALDVLEQNLQKNFSHSVPHEALCQDAFHWLKKMPSDFYDIVILDPPAFAKHHSAVGNAFKGYKEINRFAIQKIKPNGHLFTFSCSQVVGRDLFQKILFEAAHDANRHIRIVQHLQFAKDHAPSLFQLEGEYLKGFWLFIE